MIASPLNTQTHTDERSAAPAPSTHEQHITVSREALGQLLIHIAASYERFPNRKLRQALMITEHLLGLRDA